MGFNKDRRPSLDKGYRTVAVTSVTSSTGTELRAGAYKIGQPSGNKVWKLGTPRVGEVVDVYCDTRSTKDIAIQTKSTATQFCGSTNNKLTVSTGLGGVSLQFVATTSTEWAVRVTRVGAFSTRSVVTLSAV